MAVRKRGGVGGVMVMLTWPSRAIQFFFATCVRAAVVVVGGEAQVPVMANYSTIK